MIQIRKSIFETNSSSTHSLVIRKGNLENTGIDWFYHEGNNIILDGGQFGWDEETFRDPQTKANYIAVGILSAMAGNVVETSKDMRIFNKDVLNRYLEMLSKVIKEVTSCDDVIYRIGLKDYDDPNWSYIDHQSSGEFLYALEDEETLKNFIFNDNSRLIIDNDNH